MTKSTPAGARAALLGVAIAVAQIVGIACGGTGNANGESSSGGTTEGATGTANGAGSTGSAPDACMSSDECETSGHCIAPYDPAPSDGTPGRGPAACVDACIGENDLQRWCLDNVSCCDGLSCSEVDGFCVSTRPDDVSGTSSGGPMAGSSTSTGTTDASSSDGTATTGSSSTGGATTDTSTG